MKPQTQKKSAPREYKCPCGKDYLSYPALFTHIKLKHNGKAPGDISKPQRGTKPRGRPQHSSNKLLDQNGENSKQTDNPLMNSDQVSSCRDQYEKIFILLRQIVYPQHIREQIWAQVDSFKEYENFIDFSQQRGFSNEKQFVNIGIGLTQFLKDLSQRAVNWRFEQILILFMLLLQYTIDELNEPKMIFTQPLQVLIEYMNPFMDDHIEDYAAYLQISQLWALKRQNMQKLFLCFYNWLKMNDYTSFCITLIE